MKALAAAAVIVSGLTGFAQAYIHGDLPNDTHAWAVHDKNRPNPVKVTAEVGKPPSDAIVLFDGTQKSVDKNWHNWGKPTGWVATNGTFLCVPGKGGACTKQSFGDCQLHIEWMAPHGLRGKGQSRGNSGVFLMDKYEIQVLDSYETDPAFPEKNPNYPDGQAGAVYGQTIPLVNPARPAGEWQSYDIIFHQPVWKDGKVLYPGSMTVFFNGVLVQDHWELEGPTLYMRRTANAKHAEKAPLSLQDHGNPVPYRNIWIREIPSRYANTTHGGPAVNKDDVLALRGKTASRLAAKIKPDTKLADRLRAWAEVLSYASRPEYLEGYNKAARQYVEMIAKFDKQAFMSKRRELDAVRSDCIKLIAAKVLPEDAPVAEAVLALYKKYPVK